MIGAIVGDIVGSQFDFDEAKRTKQFVLFNKMCVPTDDSFMTLAIAKALFLCKGDYTDLSKKAVFAMRSVAEDHPNTMWGMHFHRWLFEDSRPYNSCGNGAAMRVSPVAWVADSEQQVKQLAHDVTVVSHNHPEGLKGAEAIALATYLARTGATKQQIHDRMAEYYPVIDEPTHSMQALADYYNYDNRGEWIVCQGSCPQALVCFLASDGFEDAIRNAVSIGGDSDTIGAMTGAVAGAYYGVPDDIEQTALGYLTDDLKGLYYAFQTISKPRVSSTKPND